MGFNNIRYNSRCGGRESPPQMPVTSIVKHPRAAARTHARKHTRHHRPQPGPRHDARGRHVRKETTGPSKKGPDAVAADIVIQAIELGSTSNTETIKPQPPSHDLGVIIDDTDPGSALATSCIIEMHGDCI